MKIALFYHIGFSGAKRVVQEHVKGLRELGNSVDVYTTDSSEDIFHPGIYSNNFYLYEYAPIKIDIPILRRIKQDFFDTFFKLKTVHKKIAEDIDSRNYDIVLVHTDINTQAPFLLRFIKTRNVYFCLEPLRNAYEYSLRLKNNYSVLNKFYENLNRWLRKRIDRKNALSADYILALSLFGRERIIGAYDRYPKVSYLGVDVKTFRPLNIKKKKQILFVADKLSIYGYDIAKEALEFIPKDIRPKIKIVSWKRNNNQRISESELVRLYNESLMTLSLSRFDTFGLVPLESMACGVPVIALNVAGYRETVIDGQTGYLTDFDPKEIAERITFLINNPKELERMGIAGRKWVEDKWTWKKQVSILNQLLYDYAHELK